MLFWYPKKRKKCGNLLGTEVVKVHKILVGDTKYTLQQMKCEVDAFFLKKVRGKHWSVLLNTLCVDTFTESQFLSFLLNNFIIVTRMCQADRQRPQWNEQGFDPLLYFPSSYVTRTPKYLSRWINYFSRKSYFVGSGPWCQEMDYWNQRHKSKDNLLHHHDANKVAVRHWISHNSFSDKETNEQWNDPL